MRASASSASPVAAVFPSPRPRAMGKRRRTSPGASAATRPETDLRGQETTTTFERIPAAGAPPDRPRPRVTRLIPPAAPPPERTETPPSDPSSSSSSVPLPPFINLKTTADGRPTVVALGKFDAMHRGHAALASRAAEMGAPVLMRFGGMAEVLGWTPSLPVVAPSDRARVLEEWTRGDGAVYSGDAPVREHVMPFAAIRRMSPEEFVRTLAEDVGVKGVVAGRNYRFGFKAAGDADALIALGAKLGVEVAIVDLVEAMTQGDDDDACAEGEEEPSGGDRAGSIIPEEEAKKRGRSVVTPPQVSSTLIRAKLAEGDVRAAASLLGRPHRLVLEKGDEKEGGRAGGDPGLMTFSLEDAMNQYPAAGAYEGRTARGTRVRVEVDDLGVRVRAAEAGDAAATRLVEETDGEAFVAVDLIDTEVRGGGGGK